jgi:membrane fusion protein, multidrug efflux system
MKEVRENLVVAAMSSSPFANSRRLRRSETAAAVFENKFSRRLLWATALVAVALACACTSKTGGGNDEAGGDNVVPVATVTVTKVVRGNIQSSLTITGTVAALPNQDVKVSALVAGRIAKMLGTEGDRVQSGQVLAQIEDRPFLDQIQQAEASVAQAKANLDNAQLSLTRNEDLFKRGIAARKDLEDARTQVSVDQAALQQAAASLSLARLQLSRTEVHAPLGGTIVKRFLSDGEQVDGTAASPIFEVADLRQVELFGNVPANYLGRIHAGRTLPVSSDAFPGKTLRGRIVAISPAVDPATNVGQVRIRISNPQGLLRLGMFLSTELALDTHSNVLLVPSQAVYRDEEGEPEVYQVEGDTATAQPVKLGLETTGQTEIAEGVKEGEAIILTGGYGIEKQAKVKVQP